MTVCPAFDSPELDLFCAEDAVAGIAQTGADVSVLVQAAVQMADVNLHVRMSLVEPL